MSHSLFSPPGFTDSQHQLGGMDLNGGSRLPSDPASLLDHYLRVDTERQNFLQSMIEKINSDSQRIRELELDLDDQKRSRGRYQQMTVELERNLQLFERRINTDAFVVVLIDGDGAKFKDDLIRGVADGGERAAENLKRAVRKHLIESGSRHEDLPILVRVYANLNDLSKALRMSQIVPNDDYMRIFAEQFTNSGAEIDFVNVGKGKENADSKIRRMLNHYHKNLQCQKIFLAGCCHDNGYLHDLREYRGAAEEKLVLIETTAAEPGFRSLGYPLVHFDGVFRSEPLNNENKRIPMSPPGLATTPFQRSFMRTSLDGQAIQLTRAAQTSSVAEQQADPSPPQSTSESSPTTAASSPVTSNSGGTNTVKVVPAAAALSPKPAPVKAASSAQGVVTSGNGGMSISYANVGGTEFTNVTVKSAKSKKDARVRFCNADGYRIDPPAQRPLPNTPAQRSYGEKQLKIKPSVFCNDHYLRGHCQWGASCDKTHNMELAPAELAIHRYKARTSPCPFGATCEDFGCYLSHHCIRDPCNSGDKCPFKFTRSGDLHLSKSDLVVTTKWTEGSDLPEKIRK